MTRRNNTGHILLICSIAASLLGLCASEHGGDAQDLALDEGSYFTNTWAVEFHEPVTDQFVNALAEKYNCFNYGKVLPDHNIYDFYHKHVSKRSLDHSGDVTDLFHSHTHIKRATQEIAKVRKKRKHIPEEKIKLKDPKWHETWYLNRGINSDQYDMNVIGAWKAGYTGRGIVVTILDDGLERDHPDLVDNYDEEASTDINSHDADPMPRYEYTNENRHGTRCAGEVAASANNTVCSVGVAYNAKIGGVRMLDGGVTDSVEAASLSYNPNHIDIYSSSWGPDDNGRTVDGPGTKAKQAFIDGVTKGRNGKGNIFMWASGNGGSHKDSCSCDGYTNSIYTLSVSSATERNTAPWYLEECASTLATTYSSGQGFSDRQIVTTDLRKHCTTSHTGTSASAPLAAGLVAVMLEANPHLTWRDVQYVTLAAANPEPLEHNGAFKPNGVNRRFSHKFGYGLMDCLKMTEIAKTWRNAPVQLIKHLPSKKPDKTIEKNGKYRGDIKVDRCKDERDWGCIRHLEHVQLALTISSHKRGSLSVKVTSPMGTTSQVLPKRSSDFSSAKFDNWPFLSVHFWGENPAGTWMFEVDAGSEAGKISSYQLILHGVSVDPFDPNREQIDEDIKCHDDCKQESKCYGSGADQCVECKSGLLRVDDTHACVERCPDGYYADKQQCKLCDSTCATCKGAGLDSCDSCQSNLLLNNQHHCAEECPQGYYPDLSANLCKTCNDNCTSCTSLEDCVICSDGFEVVNGKCMRACAMRQFRHEESHQCVQCLDKNCAECDSADACNICDPDFKLYQGKCLDDCPSPTFERKIGRDGGIKKCIDCHDSCATCNDEQDNNCMTCPDSYKLSAAHKCVMNTTCPIGQFRDLGVSDCKPCDSSCYSCHDASPGGCTSCKQDRYLRDGECMTECPAGLYPHIDEHDGHRSCQHCHWLCTQCTGPGTGNCTQCADSGKMDNGKCKPICPDHQYLKIENLDEEIKEDKNLTCADCYKDCSTCSGPRDHDCTSCPINSRLSHNKQCLAECEAGYFSLEETDMEGQVVSYNCHICHSTCLTCGALGSAMCESCDEKHILWNGQCVVSPECYKNQYYNSTANECLSCNPDCDSCAGPTELECLSCRKGREVYAVEKEQKLNLDNANPPHSQNKGQCVLCCAKDELDNGVCCDCSVSGQPKCDNLNEIELTTTKSERKAEVHGTRFITVVVIAILGAIVLYLVTFLSLQYRSHGRCVWQSSGSSMLVDGNGSVEYSSLTDKDTDTLFASDGYGSKKPHGYNRNGSSHLFDDDSD